MKKTGTVLLAGLLMLASSCDEYLDVNTNPNAPQEVSANLYLSPMLHWLVSTGQWDGRFVGRYTQNWIFATTVLTTWDRMGFDPGSDNAGEHWKTTYFVYGQNLADMNRIAEAEQRWDLLGVGHVLKAWGFQSTTDLQGEIIIKEQLDRTKSTFNYDSQEFAYQEVQRLLTRAIELLNREDGAVNQAYLAKTDKIYNGDKTKWLKLAHAMMALNLNHYSNKSSYKPAEVIAHVNKSFVSNADDALLTFPNTQNDDINFMGRTRGNYPSYRQTQFVVDLLNGTQFGGVVDPRMSRMLSPAPDGQYRGLDPDVVGFGALSVAQRPNNFYGYPAVGGLQEKGRYLFDDKARHPLMTYSQVQFIKAEAAFKMGDRATALSAYRNAISSHIDFVNARNTDNGQSPTQITAAEKAAFLASPAIVPPAANLTLSHIMSQKYIAQWAWGHNETWMDMRRYHYTELDPAGGVQVFRGFTPPSNLYPLNAGKLVYRIRARFNSEYVWNRPGLEAIGGLADDYHTKEMWITQPGS